jgi:hypothetical protein
VPSETYGNDAFGLENLGLGCIGLDLSSGINTFDVSRLNTPGESEEQRCFQPANPDPTDYCAQIPAATRQAIKTWLCPVTISVPVFHPFGAAEERLNHLAKQSATLSWSAAFGGSVLLLIGFESQGREILGTWQGDIDNGKLYIYLATQIGCDGELHATPHTGFTANINILGVPDVIERGIRSQIRSGIAEAASQALAGPADQLVNALVTNLGGLPGSTVPPAPPADAFYTQLAIGDGQATIGWATTTQRLNLVVENTEPGFADAEQRLLLRVAAGWPDGAVCTVLRSAAPDSELAFPVALDVAVPDGLPLVVRLSMTSIERVGSTWKARPLGTIGRTFSAPGYGAGQHVDTDQSFTATYSISPA